MKSCLSWRTVVEKTNKISKDLEKVEKRSRIFDHSQRNEILTLLSTLDFNRTQDTLMKDHVTTCNWLTDMSEFKHWVDEAPQWQLRLYGETGVGKVLHSVNLRLSTPAVHLCTHKC